MRVVLVLILMVNATRPGAVVADAEECPADDDSYHSKEARLRKSLLCNYDTESRPVKNHNTAVQVSMDIVITHIDTFAEMQNSDRITIYMLLALKWTDEYLVWNMTEHDNIDELRIQSDKIWIPEIILYNSETDPVATARAFSSDCMVEFFGFVICITQTSHTATCRADFTRWPYDSQNCSLIFRALMYRGEAVNITESAISQRHMLEMYKPNRFWHLESVNGTRKVDGGINMTYPSLIYNIILTRQSATHAALVTAPALVMIALTMTSILMKVSASERIYMLAVNVLLHFVYLEHLSWYVPSHGDKCPLVVIFYRDSMVLTAFVLIATALLKMLISRTTPLPKWVDTVIAVSNSSPGRWVMYASDDTDDLDKIVSDNSSDAAVKERQRNSQDWKNFVKIANRLILLTFILTYTGLFIGMILY